MKVLIHRLLTLFVVILATSISSEVFAKKIEVYTFNPSTIKDASGT